jgi:hypothetical protein
MMIAEAGAEWFYILAVVVIVGISWVAERFKAMMSDTNTRDSTAPSRPNVRRHPTSLPRPEIPPLLDRSEEPLRPAVPPAIPRPRPPARPPTAQPHAGRSQEVRRPSAQPRPAASQQPQIRRTVEERKAVIRGDMPQQTARAARDEILRSLPVPGRSAPASPPPAVTASSAQGHESWTQLTTLSQPEPGRGGEGAKLAGTRQAGTARAAPPRNRISVTSLRNLTPSDLQRALVLKEILEPPLALRDE